MKSSWTVAVAALLAPLLVSVLTTGTIAMAQDQPAADSSSASDTSEKTTPDKPADKMTKSAATSLVSPEYVIGPEDVLHVAVWRETDLTATLPVRPDGKISLPLLNDVQAAGLTPRQLAESITEKLKKYIADPRVTVVVSQINSKRIYVNGEVTHVGPMSMSANMTVLQALSSAGLNQFANTKRIYVLRTENGKQEKLPVNYRKILKGEQIEENYILKPGDTIVVP